MPPVSLLGPLARPLSMHIPDGFLNLSTSLLCWVISISILGLAIRRTIGCWIDPSTPHFQACRLRDA